MMKRFLLAPDSFKGTMTADEVCKIISEAISARIPDAEIQCVPMADGGEGMTDAYMRIFHGTKVECRAHNPRGEWMDAYYAALPDGSAVAEMAMCAGLPLMENRLDPLHATTLGVGEMILDAQARGFRKLLLGLGGSATTDCGIGMASALGYRFLDADGADVLPFAANIGKIEKIIKPEKELTISVQAACDVDNPLCGATGTAHVFAPQKGATPEMVEELDAGLYHFAQVLRRDLGADILNVPGAGAAGGLGGGVLAFLHGKLLAGAELLLDAADFDAKAAWSDMVITGEGRMDGQSIRGKVPVAVAKRAKEADVPCIALCGSLGDGLEAVYDCGITAAFAAVRGCGDFAQVKKTCREDMRILADSVLRLLLATDTGRDTDGAAWVM